MHPPIEFEIKLLLQSDGDYDRLREALGRPVAEHDQRNVYFDTPSRHLAEARHALRLRRSGEDVRITVKGPSRTVLGAKKRIEWEARLPAEAWNDVEQGRFPAVARASLPFEKLLEEVSIDAAKLKVVVAFRNLRDSFALPLGGQTRVLELDRTVFATGEVNHEVELELEASADTALPEWEAMVVRTRSDLEKLLGKHGARVEGEAEGKLTRALRYAKAFRERG